MLPPEAPGPFAASYDLGPGRGDTKVRNLSTRRCLLGVGRGARDSGNLDMAIPLQGRAPTPPEPPQPPPEAVGG